MSRAKGSRNIAASINIVWKWIIEPEKYLAWNTDFKEYKTIDGKNEKVGNTCYLVGEKGGRLMQLNCVITN